MPTADITAAGTYAQRWGTFVNRVEASASIAQPAPNATRVEPMIWCSVPPGKTPRVRTSARPVPVSRDARTIRPMGPRTGSGT